MNNDRIHWIKKNCITHFDPISRNQLTISIESGLNIKNGWDTFSTTRLTFTIRDSRTQGTNRIKIDLEYPHVVGLVDFLNKQPDWKKAFDIGAKTEVTKHYMKSKKTLSMSFIVIDGKKFIQVKIVDRTSQIIQSEIKIDKLTFKGIYRYLTSYVDNFNIIESNLLVSLSYGKFQDELFDRIDSKLTGLESRFKALNVNISEVFNGMGISKRDNWRNSRQLSSSSFDSDDSDEFQIEEKKEEKKENMVSDSNPDNMSEEFSKFMTDHDNFEDMDIGVEVGKPEKRKKKISLVNELPFAIRVLNGDVEFLSSWSSSFLFVTEKSDEDLFAPYDHILKTVNVGPDLHNHLKSMNGYYALQYLVHSFVRNVNRSHIGNSRYDIPILMFPEPFCLDERFRSISHEIIALYLIYSYATKRILGGIDNIDESIKQKFESTLLYLKVLLSPFIFSCKINKDEILYKYKLINTDESLLENLRMELSKATLGGNVDIQYEAFESYTESFVEFVSENIDNSDDAKKYVLSDKDLFDRIELDYGIVVNSDAIRSAKDIKSKMYQIDEKNNELNENVASTLEPVEKGQSDNGKFELFIKTVGGRLGSDAMRESTFDGIFSHDIPIEAYVAKRVMDIDPTLKSVSDVRKAMTRITEPENVTIGRVMGELNGFGVEIKASDTDAMMGVLELDVT